MVRVMNGVIGYIYRLHLFLRFVMENLKHRNKVIGVKQVKNSFEKRTCWHGLCCRWRWYLCDTINI